MPAQAWVTLAVGMFAAIGVLVSWRQKVEADRRAEWWRRVSWSFDQVLSDDSDRMSFGWAVIGRLKESEIATQEDREMLRSLADEWVTSKNEDEQAEGERP
ncbi:hypothetical protein LB823_15825 [Tsukamurella sp. M9C]|nr:hypothetical protein [Tsukamurella sp. M9C]